MIIGTETAKYIRVGTMTYVNLHNGFKSLLGIKKNNDYLTFEYVTIQVFLV